MPILTLATTRQAFRMAIPVSSSGPTPAAAPPVWLVASTASSNNLARSTDLTTWSRTTAPGFSDGFPIRCVAWNGSTFVAMGTQTSNFGSIGTYSANGSSWTYIYAPWGTFPDNGNRWTSADVIYGNNIWVAVGSPTGATPMAILSSTDITTWTPRHNFTAGNGQAIAYSSTLGMFLAASTSSSHYATSLNGTSWTNRTAPFSALGYPVQDATWAGTQFVAVNANAYQIAYSSNGTSWTVDSAPSGINTTFTASAVAYSPTLGMIVVVGTRTTTAPLRNGYRSTDNGATWTGFHLNLATNTTLSKIKWSTKDNLFFVYASVGTNRAVYYSSDGINWNSITTTTVFGSNVDVANFPKCTL